MGRNSWGIIRPLATAIIESCQLEHAVESGTYEGATALWLSERVKTVTTIERSQEMFTQAEQVLKGAQNVTQLFGDSKEILRSSTVHQERTLYWLDAHWFRGLPVTDDPQCPILEELEAIRSYGEPTNSVVMIDDASMFCIPLGRPYRKEEWPSIIHIMKELEGHGHFRVSVVDDVIVAGPSTLDDALYDYVHSGHYGGPY